MVSNGGGDTRSHLKGGYFNHTEASSISDLFVAIMLQCSKASLQKNIPWDLVPFAKKCFYFLYRVAEIYCLKE